MHRFVYFLLVALSGGNDILRLQLSEIYRPSPIFCLLFTFLYLLPTLEFVLEVTGAPEVKHSPLWTLGLPAAAVLGYTEYKVSVTSLSNGIEIINTTSSSITSSFRCFSLLGIPVYLLLMLLYYSAFTTVYLLDRSFDQLKTTLKTKVLPALEFLLLLGAQVEN